MNDTDTHNDIGNYNSRFEDKEGVVARSSGPGIKTIITGFFSALLSPSSSGSSVPASPPSLPPPVSPNASTSSVRAEDPPWEIDSRLLTKSKMIGSGTFGVVFSGTYQGQPVAIKELRLCDLTPADLKDFRKEVALHYTLHHPHIVQLLGAVTRSDAKVPLCIVMELMHSSLSDVLRNPRIELNLANKVRMMKEIAASLGYLHAQQPTVMHRDVKSMNILVDRHLTCKLSDFGQAQVKSHTIAKSLRTQVQPPPNGAAAGAAPKEGAVADSSAGAKVGSFPWMAPEIMRLQRYTAASDVYSLGVVLWEIVTRSQPFPDAVDWRVIESFVADKGKRLSIPPDTPAKLRTLISDCWLAEPTQRPTMASIHTQLCQLERELGGGGSLPSPEPEAPPRLVQSSTNLDSPHPSSHKGLGRVTCGELVTLGEASVEEANYTAAEGYFRRATDEFPTDPRAWAALGSFLAQVRRRPDAAQQCLRRALDIDPSHPDALLALALVTDRVRRHADAAEHLYRRAVEAAKGRQEPAVLARCYANYGAFLEHTKKDVVEAETCYKKALDADKMQSLALKNYALLLHDQCAVLVRKRPAGSSGQNLPADIVQRLDKAETCYQRAIQANLADSDTFNNYAVLLHNVRRDHDRAETYYKKAIEADPNNSQALHNYGVLLDKVRKKPEAAGGYYRKAVEADRTNAPALNALGKIYSEVEGRYSDAERCYRAALEVNPRYALALMNLAMLIQKHGNNREDAEPLYQRAIEADPSSAMAINNYAMFRLKIKGDVEGAEALFKRAIEVDGEYAPALNSYALFVKQQRKDFPKAEQLYRRAIQADPNYAPALNNYALFLQNVRKKMDLAETYFKSAIQADSTYPAALSNYAIFLHFVRGNMTLAEEFYKEAIKFDPSNPQALHLYAALLGKKRPGGGPNAEDYNQAQRYFLKAIELEPKNPQLLCNYATFLSNIRRDFDQAELYYKKAVEYNPNYPSALSHYAQFLVDIRKSPEQAERYLRRALQLDQSNADVMKQLSLLYVNQKTVSPSSKHHRSSSGSSSEDKGKPSSVPHPTSLPSGSGHPARSSESLDLSSAGAHPHSHPRVPSPTPAHPNTALHPHPSSNPRTTPPHEKATLPPT